VRAAPHQALARPTTTPPRPGANAGAVVLGPSVLNPSGTGGHSLSSLGRTRIDEDPLTRTLVDPRVVTGRTLAIVPV